MHSTVFGHMTPHGQSRLHHSLDSVLRSAVNTRLPRPRADGPGNALRVLQPIRRNAVKLFGTAATTMFCLALSGTMFVPSAIADEWNRKTTITFSAPVEIPGVHLAGWGVLPAGTYVFKIFDSQSDRHIVQIFNQDETVAYATILAIPNYRLRATSKTVMTFRERPAGQPEALRAWFYPGRNW